MKIMKSLFCLFILLLFSILSGIESSLSREVQIINEDGVTQSVELSSLNNNFAGHGANIDHSLPFATGAESFRVTGSEGHRKNNRQTILWHKIYQYTRTKSLAFGYDNNLFFGGGDYPPVEVALYPMFSDQNPPEPLWTYSSDEYSVWFVNAAERSDLYLGVNFLSAFYDPEGEGYCYLYLWHAESSIPVWTYDFSGYIPAFVDPIIITSDDQLIFVAMRDYQDETSSVYIFSTESNVPLEIITFPGSYAQILRVSDDGKIFGLLQGPYLNIFDRESNSIRQMIRIGSSTNNFDMSSDGNIIISGWRDVLIHQWDGARYREKLRYRDSDGTWYHGYCLISKDGSTAVLYAYTNDYSLNRVYLVKLLDFEIVWSYEIQRAVGSTMQMLPAQSAISDDGSVFVLGNWGDDSPENPALNVFIRESNIPYLSLSPTGSIERTAITSHAPYYVSAGGKLVHMNEWGAGTNLFLIDLEIDVQYASLSGYIRDSDTGLPLEGVRVICGDWDYVQSNQDGYYEFSRLTPGDYDLQAERVGYIDYLDENLTIPASDNVIYDITMQVLPTVTLQGRILRADQPSIGLENASIKLRGYSDYEAVSQADGSFQIDNVFVNHIYQLKIDHPFYEEFIQEIEVGSNNIILDDIILIETPFPVDNVLALVTDNNQVLVNWSDPVTGLLREFAYDNGVAVAAAGFTNGTAESVLGSIHHHHAKILYISWHLSGPITHNEVNLFIFGLDEEGYPITTELLYLAESVPNLQQEWNLFEFPTPVIAPYGFLVGISPSAGGHLGLSIDDGSDMDLFTQYTVFDYSIGMLFNIFTTGNFLIRAWGYDYGYVSYPDFDYLSVDQSDAAWSELIVNPNSGDELVSISLMHKIDSQSIIMETIPLREDSNRSLYNYHIYRLIASDLQAEDNWLSIGYTESNQYLDFDWLNIPDGIYRYAVTAVYTGDNESAPAVSNILSKNLNTDLTVYVTTFTGESAQYARVVATPVVSDNDSFEAEADAAGVATIPKIPFAFYNISVSLTGFRTVTIYNVELFEENIEIYVELPERLLPVSDLEYDIADGAPMVRLTWSAPLNEDTSRRTINSRNSLLGYQVSRNVEIIADLITDTFYDDAPPIPDLGYLIVRYGVSAVYIDGVSEAIFTEEFKLSHGIFFTSLTNVYPNPFYNELRIIFSISEQKPVRLEIYNIKGSMVKVLINETKNPGYYNEVWYGDNDAGQRVASGLYICKLTAGKYKAYRKVLLIK